MGWQRTKTYVFYIILGGSMADLEIWEFGNLEIWGPGNPEIWGPTNGKNINSQNPNPFCPKCRQGLD